MCLTTHLIAKAIFNLSYQPAIQSLSAIAKIDKDTTFRQCACSIATGNIAQWPPDISWHARTKFASLMDTMPRFPSAVGSASITLPQVAVITFLSRKRDHSIPTERNARLACHRTGPAWLHLAVEATAITRATVAVITGLVPNNKAISTNAVTRFSPHAVQAISHWLLQGAALCKCAIVSLAKTFPRHIWSDVGTDSTHYGCLDCTPAILDLTI